MGDPFRNSAGQISLVTNPKAETDQYNYNSQGYLTSIVHTGAGYSWQGSISATKSFGYDFYGRVNSTTDWLGYNLLYSYDSLDRMTNITFPDGTRQRYVYSRLDLTEVYDRTGNRSVFTYDGTGRCLTAKDRLNRETQYAWCGCGGLESIIDPQNHATAWSHDLEGRILAKAYNDSTQIKYTYDQRSSRLASITDAKNQVKLYAHNVDDTLASITYNNAVVSTPTVSFTYDPNYRRVKTMNDGSGLTTYTYNPITGAASPGSGRLASEASSFANATINYSYDALGRITNRAIGGVNDGVTFDGLGRVLSHTSVLGEFDTWYWNAQYQYTITPGAVDYPNGQEAQFYYTNNAGDNRLELIENVTAYDYYSEVSDNWFYSDFWYAYNSLGRVTQLNSYNSPGDQQWYATNTIDTYSYDAEGQLAEDQVSSWTNNLIVGTNLDYAYEYDLAGNRIGAQLQAAPAQNESFPGTGGTTVTALATPVRASQSAYNSVNQLQTRNGSGTVPVRISGSVNEPAAVTVNGQVAQETIDPSSSTGGDLFTYWANLSQGGNSVQIQATDNGANGANVATKHADIYVAGSFGADKVYSYDNNGNCTGYTSSSGNVTYGWDAENRLILVTKGNNSSTFSYDGLSRCVQIVESTSGTVTTSRLFVWSGTARCEERDANNNVTKRFFPEGEQITGNSYYFTFDRLGSVEQMTDFNGDVHAWYNYDAFGNRTKLAGDMDADFGFDGYYYHTNSGLYLTLYRGYDPDSGRWLNRDPIAEAGGINLYGFVYNNPLNLVDPSGRLGIIEILGGLAAGTAILTAGVLWYEAEKGTQANTQTASQAFDNAITLNVGGQNDPDNARNNAIYSTCKSSVGAALSTPDLMNLGSLDGASQAAPAALEDGIENGELAATALNIAVENANDLMTESAGEASETSEPATPSGRIPPPFSVP